MFNCDFRFSNSVCRCSKTNVLFVMIVDVGVICDPGEPFPIPRGDDESKVCVQTRFFGEYGLQLVAINTGDLFDDNPIKFHYFGKRHQICIICQKLNVKILGAQFVPGQLHFQTVTHVDELFGSGHHDETAAAQLVQNFGCVCRAGFKFLRCGCHDRGC